MEVKIDFTRSAQDNANNYYERSKRLAHKIEGAHRSVENLEERLQAERKRHIETKKQEIRKVRKREWYEKFHWFYVNEEIMAIGGRDAKQNEKLNSDYFEDGDLFFHADIFGASVVILKNGLKASEEAKKETAQFAASYSSAWDNMQKNVDVYAMRREQVSKATSKGSLGTGSFLLTGEREWFRHTELGLAAYVENEKLYVVPALAAERLGIKKYLSVTQGKKKKSDAAKDTGRMLDYDDIDYIMQQFPTNNIEVAFKE